MSTPTNYIHRELAQIPIRHTKVILGLTVTRWSADKYEVGTWGKAANCFSCESAVDAIITKAPTAYGRKESTQNEQQ